MELLYTDICRTGKSFFWCVGEKYGGFPLAHGKCETLEEAQELMWGCSQILRMGRTIEDFSENGCGHFAKLAMQAVWRKESTKPSGEFVYEQSYGNSNFEYKFEIIRKTQKKLYILESNDYEDNTLILDRLALEKNGEVRYGRLRRTFYSEPYEVRCAKQIEERERMKLEIIEEYQQKIQSLTDDEVERWREKLPTFSYDLLVEIAYEMKIRGISVDRHLAS